MKVRIHVEKCIGSGQCVLAAPAVFDQRDDDGIVVLLDENPGPKQHIAVRKAAKLCPAQVIIISDDDQ